MGETTLTIAGFQRHISERYEKVDRERGAARTFVYVIEEVGELATALAAIDKSPGDAAARANLEEEFADVLAWLCTLANITDVDLSGAVERKYLGKARPEGHK
jgi:NTP pyrophosphatase (non-canonical NTP hydrolase)